VHCDNCRDISTPRCVAQHVSTLGSTSHSVTTGRSEDNALQSRLCLRCLCSACGVCVVLCCAERDDDEAAHTSETSQLFTRRHCDTVLSNLTGSIIILDVRKEREPTATHQAHRTSTKLYAILNF